MECLLQIAIRQKFIIKTAKCKRLTFHHSALFCWVYILRGEILNNESIEVSSTSNSVSSRWSLLMNRSWVSVDTGSKCMLDLPSTGYLFCVACELLHRSGILPCAHQRIAVAGFSCHPKKKEVPFFSKRNHFPNFTLAIKRVEYTIGLTCSSFLTSGWINTSFCSW